MLTIMLQSSKCLLCSLNFKPTLLKDEGKQSRCGQIFASCHRVNKEWHVGTNWGLFHISACPHNYWAFLSSKGFFIKILPQHSYFAWFKFPGIVQRALEANTNTMKAELKTEKDTIILYLVSRKFTPSSQVMVAQAFLLLWKWLDCDNKPSGQCRVNTFLRTYTHKMNNKRNSWR